MDEKGNSNLPGGKGSKEAAAKGPAAAEGKKPTVAKQGGAVAEVSIDDFHLTKGTIDFTDRGVPGPFRAQVRDIDVHLTGMSTVPARMADLRARLVLPKGAPLTITGKADPLKEPAYADMDLVLDKLDLTTATPYAGTFLGLEVDKGTLTVKSRAKIDKGDIAAENRIWVEQLTYGKAVKSDKATILPVSLLTDILRNKDGDIVMVLPVAARTDDENLVGTVIFQAAGEVVFPPGSPVRNVEFEPCSTELSSREQERLRKLAEAMRERPAMRVTAVGFVDPGPDAAACRVQAAAPSPIPGMPAPRAGEGAPPAPPEDAMLAQLARGRAAAVRMYLVQVGEVDASRVASSTRDVRAAPAQKDARRARVEFVRGTD
jgi:hypothetical protein